MTPFFDGSLAGKITETAKKLLEGVIPTEKKEEMTAVFNALKINLTIARKNQEKNKVEVLSFIVGDLVGKGTGPDKVVSDEVAITYLKKTISNLNDLITAKKARGDDTTNDEYQVTVLSDYVPAQLTDEELVNVIKSNGFTKQADFMKFLKDHYPSLYDGKHAVEVFKSNT